MVGTQVVVATCTDPAEALNAQRLLMAEGIHAVLSDGELAAIADTPAICYVRVQVPVEEVNRATRILTSKLPTLPVNPEARRAMFAALVPVVQLYSLWLVARLLGRWRRLSPFDRRLVALAAVANLLWMAAILALVVGFAL